MKREVLASLNFIIYVMLPYMAIRIVMEKYPGVISPHTAILTMAYFIALFVFSLLSIYSSYDSLPTILSVVTTMIYIQLVLSNISLKVQGAVLSINLSEMLMLLYILLSLKIVASIYSDVKQKYLSSTTD